MGKESPADEHNGKGVGLMSEKRWGEAVACFTKAVQKDPDNADYHENLGLALRGQGNDTEAARVLRRTIALRPRSPRALAALGELMLEHCNVTGAAECFRKAFEAQPGTAWGHVQMSRALLEEGNAQSAAECAQVAITLDSSLAGAYTILGSALQELGSFKDAEEALIRSIEIQEEQAEAYFKLVYGKKLGEPDRALIDSMQNVLNGSPSAEERRLLNYALGKTLEDLGEYEAAIRHYDFANETAFNLQMNGQPLNRAGYTAESDRSIQTFTKSFFKQFAHLGSLSDTPIFVIGMMRSGTTLLEQILARHSRIGAAGETHFWMGKGAKAIRSTLGAPTPDALKTISNEYLNLLRVSGAAKPHVTDKDPLNFRYLGEIRLAFPKAKFIHCRRDPVDNCLSIYTTPYRVPAEFSYNRENIVFAYQEYLRLMEHWRSVLQESEMIEVDYEALVENPQAATQRILEFLGLEWEESCLQHGASRIRIGTPSFWQARQPVYSSSVKRAQRFEAFLGPFAGLGTVNHP